MSAYRFGFLYLIMRLLFILLISINLLPMATIPLGLSLAYGYTSLPDYTTAQYNSTSLFNAKLAYTRTKNLQISIDATTFTAPYAAGQILKHSNVETRIMNYSLNVIIYFN